MAFESEDDGMSGETVTYAVRYVEHGDGWRYRIAETDDGCVHIQYEEPDAERKKWSAVGDPLVVYHEWWQQIVDAAAACIQEYKAAEEGSESK